MPILSDFQTPGEFMEPDSVPRPLVAFGIWITTPELRLDPHSHRKAQLMLSVRGVLTCEVENGLWLVPPQCAFWVPGGVTHAVKASGHIEGYDVFIDPALAADLPKTCCTVSVSPLMRELVMRAAQLPYLYPEDGPAGRLAALLLDEIAAAPVEMLHLPMPTDRRLRQMADMMMANPSDRGTMATWARRCGLSGRTLARLQTQQTGMSFGRWRQQMAIVLALKWLAGGASIQQVAADLGYEGAGSFITMFRKALGASPARYMANRATATSAREPRAMRP